MGGGELFKKIKPVSTGIDLPATSSDREFKKKYDEQAMGIDTDGFTIYVSLNSSKDMDEMFYDGDTVTPPTTYFRFKIGETPTYSFYFGNLHRAFQFWQQMSRLAESLSARKPKRLRFNLPKESLPCHLPKAK